MSKKPKRRRHSKKSGVRRTLFTGKSRYSDSRREDQSDNEAQDLLQIVESDQNRDYHEGAYQLSPLKLGKRNHN